MKTESSHHSNSGVRPGNGDILCCLLLTALCVFVFRKALLDGSLLFGSDFVGFYQGLKQFLLDEVHNRHAIPFWNPYVFGGMPFWAHLESTIFYPLDFPFWFMAPEKAFGYTMFMHMLLAALFMYGLLRSFHMTRGGSLVGAVVFTCNGFIMATLYDGQMFRVQAYIWLPLVIWVVNSAFKSKSPYGKAVLAGLLWGFQILSGSPQDALYTLMAVFLFCLLADSHGGEQGGNWTKALGKKGLLLILFMVFGFGTAAIQIVPAMEFIRLSVRSVFDTYDLVTLGSYPFQGIITALIPDFFGKYTTDDFWVSNVPWSIPLYNLYVGILPLILLVFLSFKRDTDRGVLIFAVLLVLSAFFLALGANTPLYKVLYMLPGFDRIRAPAKIIYLYVFAFGILAGKGVDGLFSMSVKSVARRTWIILAFCLLMILLDLGFHWNKSLVFSFFSWFLLDDAIPGKMPHGAELIKGEFHIITMLCAAILLVILSYGRGVLHRKIAVVLFCSVIIFDLVYMNRGALRYDDKGYASTLNTKRSLARSLGKDKTVFRVGSYPNAMGPNFEMYLGYQTVTGYNPLYLHRYYDFIHQYNPSLLDPGDVWFFYTPVGNAVLMDLLNVKYEISHKKNFYNVRKTFLPRLFFVPGHEILERSKILDRLVSSGFDPKEKILFEMEDSPEITLPQKESPPVPVEEPVTEIFSYGPDEIMASVQAPKPGYLFFSEIFYPGWKAYVNDRSVPLLRGNYLFRVVQVPQGKHTVTLRFEPASIKTGISITTITLIIISMLLVCGFFRRRRLGNKFTRSTF